MTQSVRDTKKLARQTAEQLPATLLKGQKPVHKPHYPKRALASSSDQIEASYDQLEGEWQDWLEVARRYEHKVPAQDRYDMRHIILIELHHARQRDKEPIPLLRAYRIASLTVALYWRQVNRIPITASLDQSINDSEGYEVRLRDIIADDNAIDLAAWLDAGTWLLGCPMRLAELAGKRRDGIPLNENDRRYFNRQKQKQWASYQKTLL